MMQYITLGYEPSVTVNKNIFVTCFLDYNINLCMYQILLSFFIQSNKKNTKSRHRNMHILNWFIVENLFVQNVHPESDVALRKNTIQHLCNCCEL